MTANSTETTRVSTPAPDPAIGLDRNERWSDLAGLTVVFAALVPTLTIVLALTHADLDVPWEYRSDANLALMSIKNIVRGGWYLTSDLLGAPFGQKLYDYPAPGDWLSFAVIKGMATVGINHAPRILNLFYLGTFFAVGTSAFLVLRILRFPLWISTTLAFVYAILPDHFLRGETHLLLSAYQAVPVAVLVLYLQLRREPWLEARWSAWRSRRGLLMVLACALVAGSGFYYVFFFLLMLGMGALVRGATDHSWRPLAAAAVAGGVVVAIMALANADVALYRLSHDSNPAVATRSAAESELYGLKATNLFLPIVNHRLESMEVFRERVGTTFIPSEGSETMGVILVIGLVLLLAGIARRVLRGPPAPTERSDLLDVVSLATSVGLVFAIIGGVSPLFGIAGFTQVRAWNRITVYIAFFSLLALAVALERLTARLAPLRRWWVVATVAGALMALAAFDQTSTDYAPRHAAVAREFHNDGRFIAALERHFGPGADVFQLPYMPFPENGAVGQTGDYDHLRGYIHSDTLRWSYAGMKGREAEWQAGVASARPARLLTDLLAVAGFDAIYVDRAGLPDVDAELEAQLSEVLGDPVTTSENGMLAAYDLTPAKSDARALLSPEERTRLRQEVLHPLRLVFGEGFYGQETSATETWRWVARDAVLTVENPGSEAVPATLDVEVDARDGARLSIRWPDGGEDLRLATSTEAHRFEIDIPPGTSQIRFSTDAPPVKALNDPRDLRFRLLDLRLESGALQEVRGALEEGPQAPSGR